MSSRKSNMHNVLEKNILIHLIKAKEMVVLQFTLGNWNQALKYSQTLFYTFVFLECVCFVMDFPVAQLQCRRPGFDPWVGKIPWRREWLPTLVFLPGEFHGQRSLAGYSPWGCKSRTRLSDSNSTLLLQFVLCFSFICCL